MNGLRSSVYAAAPLAAIAIVGGPLAVMVAPARAQFSGQQSYCWATLSAEEDDVQIHVNAGPGPDYDTLSYHEVGETAWLLRAPEEDDPRVLDTAEDGNGLTWYRVGFPETAEEGWLREDLMMPQCAD